MNLNRKSLLLYAVTDRSWLNGQTLSQQVELALRGGVTFLQLREKDLAEEKFKTEALKIKELCLSYDVPFVLNDNVKLAIETDADGVHVGQTDMNPGTVRKMIGQDKILGVTAESIEDALAAEAAGADYLGVGSVFPTSTKLDADLISIETLKEICASVKIPVVAIGGITKDNLRQLKNSGIAGIAVVSAIFAQSNIEQATRELKDLLSKE
ncbi:MAG: thiamine phosphate synthase [Clostridiaceae bacterium]|jgi:thiamine-phosphate pyrophosphorylase|nr:thiamine phosphate synthase [Bacillota bacterium]NLN51410.1 thiamine phosphate synthase [Clostridiaceae bacterium]